MNKANESKKQFRIVVGMGTCGCAAGADLAFKTLKKLSKDYANIEVVPVGCIGSCRFEPLVEIYEGSKRTTYINLNEEKVQVIFDKHLLNNEIVNEYLINEDINAINELSFFKKQTRLVLNKCGVINPEDIEEYIHAGGYQALGIALNSEPSKIIETITESGLRGRGGAGFKTGLKWQIASTSKDKVKYVICNADEGDPGAYMDRAILEGDPHAVIEAMIIAGLAIGAHQGYIYVRAEYPLAVKRLEIAIEQAKKHHFLGNNILDKNIVFNIDIRLGAGAFVCGEETALITSIEGNRGEPRVKPPFPVTSGLYGHPTVINNVETLANIANIILKGSDWFKQYGSENSPGTKVFALGGDIVNNGLVEVGIGITLKDIVYDIGGGIPNDKKFKAAQTGGPSGGCIPASLINTPVDYETLNAIGSMMGSGGLIVLNEDNCMVDVAKFFLEFSVDESCGKCTPCRIGTKQIYDILDRITSGQGVAEDIQKLEDLCEHLKLSSLCGLGQAAPNPVISTMQYFKDEYTSHIYNHICPAKVCKKMIMYQIDQSKCTGCSACSLKCPVNAISGVIKTPYQIDQSKCIKCDNCYQTCRFNAIDKK